MRAGNLSTVARSVAEGVDAGDGGAASLRVMAAPAAALGGDVPEHAVYDRFEPDLRAEWNALAERAGDLMTSYDWCEAWWRYFGTGRTLEIHTLRASGRLVGVLPLYRERLWLGAAWLRVVRLVGNEYTVEAVGLAVESAWAAKFMVRVLDGLDAGGGWDALHLGPLRGYATVSESMGRAAAGKPQVQAVIHGACDNWQTYFDLPASYEGYMGGLEAFRRKDIERSERRLGEGHTVEFAVARDPDEAAAALDGVVQLHQRLWTRRGKPGHFGELPAVERFHRELAGRFVGEGRVMLVTLRVDGQLLGATFAYHFGERTHSLQRGYVNDEPWRRYSLGRLLHCRMVRCAIERGSREIDDGRGIFEYKLRLGGRLQGERSLLVLRGGALRRLRFWAALRLSYLVHVIYSRIWLDHLAPRLGRDTAAGEFYIRSSWLAKLRRRSGFGLFGGQVWQEARHVPQAMEAYASSAERGGSPGRPS